MMNMKTVKNSIADVILNNDFLRVPRSPQEMVEDIYWIIAVVSWEHKVGDNLAIEDLTDAEYRLVIEWYFYNRGRYQTTQKIEFIGEMREMFPGLSLRTAYNIVTVKEREW